MTIGMKSQNCGQRHTQHIVSEMLRYPIYTDEKFAPCGEIPRYCWIFCLAKSPSLRDESLSSFQLKLWRTLVPISRDVFLSMHARLIPQTHFHQQAAILHRLERRTWKRRQFFTWFEMHFSSKKLFPLISVFHKLFILLSNWILGSSANL